MPIPTNEDKTMKTHVSLTGLSAAVMLFVTGVAIHEAASAVSDGMTARVRHVPADVTKGTAARTNANATAATSRPSQFGGVQNMTTFSFFAQTF